jgi:hypothetical protein
MGMKSIASTTLSTTGSFSFTSIPQTYKDLMLVMHSRENAAAYYGNVWFKLNGVGTNYAEGGSYTNGSNNGAFLGDRTDYWYKNNYISAASATANAFGPSSFYIPNYTSAFYKMYSGHSVGTNAASSPTNTRQGIASGVWANTAAVTSITIIAGGDFIAGSTATLYGIS